jgi:hypothetical protein
MNRLACAWCGKEIKAGVEPTSHGICERCAEIEVKKYAAQKGRAA